jgi:hypothetical protein
LRTTRSGAEPGSVVILTVLQIIEVLQAPFGTIDQRPIVGVAFGDVELAADHVIAGLGIAADVDPLDIGALPLLDREKEVDGPPLAVAIRSRLHRGERETLPRGFDRHVLDRFLDRFRVVDVARRHPQARLQQPAAQRRYLRADLDGADPILLALVDREGDDESLLRRVELAQRRHHPNVDIAMLEVEAAQELAVRLDPVRIIDVAGLQEGEQAGFHGLDLVLQTIGRIGVIADEVDGLDVGLGAFADLEHQVDAAVGQFDDLGIDVDVEAAAAPIDLDHALHVGLDHGARKRAALLRLDFQLELVLLDLLVALECDSIDDRVFDQGHDDAAAGLADAHVLEQAGRVQRLVGVVDHLGVETAARSHPEIGADRRGFDAPIAFDDNRIDRGRTGRLRIRNVCRQTGGRQAQYYPPENKAGDAQSPNKPHTKVHSQPALFPLLGRLVRGAIEPVRTPLLAGFCRDAN